MMTTISSLAGRRTTNDRKGMLGREPLLVWSWLATQRRDTGSIHTLLFGARARCTMSLLYPK
jgi:hypothetical protein